MGKYLNQCMDELCSELSAGPARLRKGHIDASEELLRMVAPQQDYPYEFILYRLTGYRGAPSGGSDEPIDGKSLRRDLCRLMMDLCDSVSLATSAYDEKIYDIATLARQFHISTKTLQRWRRKGLPARRLVFPDGRRRVAFLDSSVRWFLRKYPKQVKRSIRFSKLTAEEKKEIVRRARRMVGFTHCTLSEVARRIAAKLGRAPETIRYTLRDHDRRHPSEAVFPDLGEPLGDSDKAMIYKGFLNGLAVTRLAERYHRTRGSIYRIVNEMRAGQLLGREISFVYNPQFDLPGAEETIVGSLDGRGRETSGKQPLRFDKDQPPPQDLPPYLASLYRIPLLEPEEERDLFRRYNYLKYRADTVRRQIDVNRVRAGDLKRVESLLLQANVVKNRIVRANLRLVVSIAKKHIGGPQTLFELISDGNVALMRAVEKFDYARGFRFSTYASWAIMRNFARSVPKERYQLDRFATGNEEVLDIAASLRTYDPNEENLPELREMIDAMLTRLTPRERTILTDHYGLNEGTESKTFHQLGRKLGISKERVRQIELQALRKLRRMHEPEAADLLS